jgi:Ca-activated chloride channel homolog
MMFRLSVPLGLLAVVSLAFSQNLGERDYDLSVNVQLVQLPVSVLDKNGFPVLGIERESFSVYEDKIQQEISLFKQEDVPLSVGLVVDVSGSMRDKVNSLNTAAMTFVHESNAEDETAIVSFGDDANLEQDFTRDTRKLSRALSHIPSSGYTALYDAVFLAATHLGKSGTRDKKVLLIISDGEDNHSKYKREEVLEAIRESKIILYSIGLLSPDSGSGDNYMADGGKRTLKQLAEVTGGAAFFPKGTREVEQACKRIARELRSQYTVGYRPTNDKLDGTWRRTMVRVNPPKSGPKIKVRTKQGYYAPLPKNARAALPAAGSDLK